MDLLLAKMTNQRLDRYSTQIVKNFNLYTGTIDKLFLFFKFIRSNHQSRTWSEAKTVISDPLDNWSLITGHC